MNIFVLDEDPIVAAKMYCDKHVPKLVVEMLQMCGSAVIRHGATPEQLPVAKSTQKPIRGGYHNHPVTRWVGDSRTNFLWAAHHGAALCEEYTKRFGKEHYCANGIEILYGLAYLIPEGDLTPFALAMPDEFRPVEIEDDNTFSNPLSHASGIDAVDAYRRYYHSKAFAVWEKGRPMPDWFSLKQQAVLA
tara:strand:- start:25 stop:594 length:570 start_codon:yes stop_codon:yes gene_type:complete